MGSNNKKIWIIDDDRIFSKGIAYYLQTSYKAYVQQSHSGRDVYEHIAKNDIKFDLVLLDYDLGDSKGYEIIELLYKNNYKGEVIIISGQISDRMQELFKSYHVKAILPKGGELMKNLSFEISDIMNAKKSILKRLFSY